MLCLKWKLETKSNVLCSSRFLSFYTWIHVFFYLVFICETDWNDLLSSRDVSWMFSRHTYNTTCVTWPKIEHSWLNLKELNSYHFLVRIFCCPFIDYPFFQVNSFPSYKLVTLYHDSRFKEPEEVKYDKERTEYSLI